MRTGFLAQVSPFTRLLVERLVVKCVKLCVLSYVLAWLLACTPNTSLFETQSWPLGTSVQTHVNVPVAIVVVLVLHWLSTHLVLPTRETQSPHTRRYRKFHKPVEREYYYRERQRTLPDRDAWKKRVNAPIVESAWESFCGSIVQEWIYDSWYSTVSPDREFPAEIRRLLNDAFAEGATRARRVDLRTLLLRDMCDLFTEQLDLYRSTKSAVGILNDQDISLAAKDRAFQLEMKTEHTLHAAFYSRDGHYRMIKRMAEGVVGLLLNREDLERPALRSLSRDLLATCVLRSIIMLFNPYNANKILSSLLKPKKETKLHKNKVDGSMEVSKETNHGRVQFDQRVRNSVALEELANRRSRDHPVGMPCPKSQPNLTTTVEETAEHLQSTSDDGSMESKDVLEETDLLEGGKNETDGVLPTAQTSLPWIARAVTPPSEDVEGAIDSHVSIEDISFVGHPRAKVVAPEMVSNDGREYVVFKIRVADEKGEWTVARRYRNFEALHKCLRDLPVYRLLNPKLPSKMFVFRKHMTEMVEQRRIALDLYLQTILSCEELAFSRHVWLFLSDQSCRTFAPDVSVGLVKTIVNNVANARYQIKRCVTENRREGEDIIKQRAPGTVASKVDLKREMALRALDGSECSSVSGSMKIDDEGDWIPSNGISRSRNASPHRIASQQRERRRSRSKQGRRPSKRVGFAGVLDHPSEAESLSGEFGHDDLLSRFDHQDRDAIDRQVDRSPTRKGFTLLQSTSTDRLHQGETSGSEDDEDRLDEFDNYVGISAPLYEVADAIFNFPAQKFFRRQMFQAMRQVLSFLAGDTIDVYLNHQVNGLRSEHTLARLIHALKSTLWPGGVWFTMTTNRPIPESNAPPQRNKGIQSDRYLEAATIETDAEEMAESLKTRLFRHAPAVLVRLVGRKHYMEAMKDVYDMLQLPTCVRQIGYGVVEIVLLALFPELKDLFAKIHREARFMPESRR